MKCIVSSQNQTNTTDKILSVTIPTKNGSVQIKQGHAEYFTELTPGKVVYVTESSKTVEVEIENGVCHVYDDVITLLV